jgi:hypothetical protein
VTELRLETIIFLEDIGAELTQLRTMNDVAWLYLIDNCEARPIVLGQ